MFIKEVRIVNFRLLKNVPMTLGENSTVIVGRNNSGKTSLTEIFRRFFWGSNPFFQLEDFSLASLGNFKKAFHNWQEKVANAEIRNIIPEIQLSLIIEYNDTEDFGSLCNFIIDVDESTKEAQIKISYRLMDGKIDELFEGLDSENNPQFFKKIKERVPKLFFAELTAIDPTDSQNTTIIEYTKLKNLINVDFINAQRGLDDVTQSEKDILGKVLCNIFKTASSNYATPDMHKKAQELEVIANDIQLKMDSEFKQKVDELLPALSIFGYPGLSDPRISTETTFNIQTMLESNTTIRYKQTQGISLPETYNGLGSRNLIYMLFQLFEFFRKFQSNVASTKINLIFIEEPEAHLHPQMQEVFIRQLNNLAKAFVASSGCPCWPVQFVVSTHSTHVANEANFESIRYFVADNTKSETCIKDLSKPFNTTPCGIDKTFIHKYLTLTKCDLFFADKAILVEGATERILMPRLIEKTDADSTEQKLSSQYISVIEVGGAYSHHFYDFLDFLDLKSLIITDIDSTTQEIKNGKTTYCACPVSEGTFTSNASIKKWFKDSDPEITLSSIQSKSSSDKVRGVRRLAFQIPEKNTSMCGRSFEDAFILANESLFMISDESEAYMKAKEIKKTNFALEHALYKTDWQVPLYLKEGLQWLATNSTMDTGNNHE